jgi:hypothetical protein
VPNPDNFSWINLAPSQQFDRKKYHNCGIAEGSLEEKKESCRKVNGKNAIFEIEVFEAGKSWPYNNDDSDRSRVTWELVSNIEGKMVWFFPSIHQDFLVSDLVTQVHFGSRANTNPELCGGHALSSSSSVANDAKGRLDLNSKPAVVWEVGHVDPTFSGITTAMRYGYGLLIRDRLTSYSRIAASTSDTVNAYVEQFDGAGWIFFHEIYEGDQEDYALFCVGTIKKP